MQKSGNIATGLKPRFPVLQLGLIIGLIAGVFVSWQPTELSRWSDYQAVTLGMEQGPALSVIEKTSKSRTGCGAFHWENRDLVCRFEDPWRGYIINFDPQTKVVNRKYFYFKASAGVHPSVPH